METEQSPNGAAPQPAPPGASAPQTPPAPVVKPREPFPVSRREKLLFPVLWLWCAFCWEVLLLPMDTGRLDLGLGVTLAVVLFDALVWVYLGAPRTAAARWLLGGHALLGLLFAFSSTLWLNAWNLLLLAALTPLLLYEWSGGGIPWYDPRMLLQRLLAFVTGCFEALGLNADLFRHREKSQRAKGLLWVVLGLVIALGLLAIALPLLLSADALFSQVAGRWVDWLGRTLGRWVGRLVLGAFLLPFLFSLLYTLRDTKRFPLPTLGQFTWTLEPALWVTVLAVLDALYVFFLAVQSAALFGGPDYLQARGITYAEYARSGFFQLVGVVFLNLTVLLLAVQLSRKEGRLWRGVQAAGGVLLAESAVLLVSAAWRMTLYVGAFGLSFKRLLTYWGMALAAVYLAAALWKLLRPKFRFFRVLFSAALAGWLLLCAADPAYLVTRYNVDAYRRGELNTVSAQYLLSLSYDAVGPLSDLLPKGVPIQDAAQGYDPPGYANLSDLLDAARAEAVRACGDYRSWNLSAYLAAWS